MLSWSLETPTIRRWKDKPFRFTVLIRESGGNCAMYIVERSNSKSEILKYGGKVKSAQFGVGAAALL